MIVVLKIEIVNINPYPLGQMTCYIGSKSL